MLDSIPRNRYLDIGSAVRSSHSTPIGVYLPLTRSSAVIAVLGSEIGCRSIAVHTSI